VRAGVAGGRGEVWWSGRGLVVAPRAGGQGKGWWVRTGSEIRTEVALY
jgi:hypothetical protein